MKYTLGTRGSALAIKQTEMVIAMLTQRFPGDEFSYEVLKTTGCKKQGTPQAAKGDKRDWIHELEEALVAGEIDLAVHSGKDVPVELDSETVLLSVLKRDFPEDVFIGKRNDTGVLRLSDLTANNVVGTASKRRQAQLQRGVPGVLVQDHRGNVPTRLAKLRESEVLAGIVLARAGLERLGLYTAEMEPISTAVMLPAVGQGTLAVQCRRSDTDLIKKIRSLMDPAVQACFDAERACIRVLQADCHSAVSAYGQVLAGGVLDLKAQVFSLDGSECIECSQQSSVSEPESIGISVGESLIKQGALELLEDARKQLA